MLGSIAAALTDGLRNLVSGLGGANDKAQGATFVMKAPTRQEIDACYRSTWLGRKIHDIPALDMTREWRGWQAEDDQIEAIELVEKNLQVRRRVRKALVEARLYGGAAIIMGLPGDPKTPAPEKIGRGALKYLHVMHRHQLHMDEQVRDLLDPLFGQPRMFRLPSQDGGALGAEIHPSRVVAFTGAALPEGTVGNLGEDWYWGDPLLVSVFDALAAHDTGLSAIANMLNEAKTDIVRIPGFMDNLTSAEYERTLMERFSLAALLKSITNTLVLDGGDGSENSGEVWEQRQINWTGLPEIQRTLMQIVSGAADIPATRLMGQSPSGMNATGESDTRNYYDMLSSLQNSDLTPTMATLDEYLIMSATGARDPAVFYEWNPLWQMTPGEKAERDQKVAQTASAYATMGVVPDDAFAVAVQNRLIEDGVFPGLEAAIEEADKVARLMAEEPEPGTVDPNTGLAVPVPGANTPLAGLPAPANQNARPGAGGQPKGGGPGKATGTFGGNSKRRAANDRARKGVRDRATLGLMDSDLLLLTDDMRLDFNPNHVRSGRNGGEFTSASGGGVTYEVAPDPDDKEATARWNALTDEQREQITEEMTAEFVPQITRAVGAQGEVLDAYGGYQGEINPSQMLILDSGDPFEVAGVIGHVFNQKAMVVTAATQLPGTDAIGMVAVELPNGDAKSLRALQDKLGSYAEDGWSYHAGKVQLLNFTGKSNVDLAKEIDAKLGGQFTVGHGTVYSALVERENYASPRNDGQGNAWGERGNQLRNAFGKALGAKIQKAKGGKADRRGLGDRYDPNQPRDPGGEGGGQWVAAGASGAIAGLDEVEQLTNEAKASMAAANAGKDVDQIRLEAGHNQIALRKLGGEIQDSLGVTFAEPPKGFEVKSRDSILRKVASENYDGPHQLRDISRATFVVPTATKADMVVGALAARGTVYDRGWTRDVNSGYAARFVYLRHPNGGVSEIQIVPNRIAQIKMGEDLKSNGPGHVLYEVMRDPTKDMDVRRVAARKSRTLYNRVLHKSFYAVLGIGMLPNLPGITH